MTEVISLLLGWHRVFQKELTLNLKDLIFTKISQVLQIFFTIIKYNTFGNQSLKYGKRR